MGNKFCFYDLSPIDQTVVAREDEGHENYLHPTMSVQLCLCLKLNDTINMVDTQRHQKC